MKALLAAGFEPGRVLVAGRSNERAEALAARYGVTAVWGGAERVKEPPPLAIVAVTEESLAPVAAELVERGARRVLVEKPGALRRGPLAELGRTAARAAASVFVAYNRRFYPAVERARSLIEEDGGPLSLAFEFTEIEGRVLDDARQRGLTAQLLERWGIANSLHVIDLAFHLAGPPEHLTAERAGALDWHPAGAVYGGAGTTAVGAVFSYLAVWSGAGRWGIEVTTRERRLVLRPLETLQEQLRGSLALEPVRLPAEPAGLKAGLAGQLAAFLTADGDRADPRLCTVEEASRRIELAERILGYD